MHVTALINHIEETADLKLAAEWDQSGVQIAGEKNQINRLAVILDPDEPSISKALDWKADFILAHHPLTLSPELPKFQDSYNRICRKIFKSDAWLYSAHTSLDVQTTGPVAWLGRALKLDNLLPVQELLHNRHPEGAAHRKICGYGVLGYFSSGISWPGLAAELKNLLQTSHWIYVGAPPPDISCFAYCPGSGMDFAEKAYALGADIFVSGDLKYHQAQKLESKGFTIDVGHFVLEERMMQQWSMQLREDLQDNDLQISFFPGHNPLHVQV